MWHFAGHARGRSPPDARHRSSRMDTRVSELLLECSGHRPGSIRITYQDIADELGSSREVVSRILEDLKGRGLVRLFRGGVEVVEPESLERSTLS
jgi:CRP/FNR family transcriptional regulator